MPGIEMWLIGVVAGVGLAAAVGLAVAVGRRRCARASA